MDTSLFSTLTTEQKVDFFVKCQTLLIKHHSNSPFAIRPSNLQKSLDAFSGHIKDYKGHYFTDENICVLFNYIFVDDSGNNINELNKGKILRANAYKPPADPFNGISIDFVVFRNLVDSIGFIRGKDDPRIKYVLFVKDGKIKLHLKTDLMNSIPNLSSVQ